MVGYPESLTDPSYYGQLMITTNAHIGNYGANKFEIESNSSQIKGLVVKKFAHHFSRYGDDNELLNDFLLFISSFHNIPTCSPCVIFCKISFL